MTWHKVEIYVGGSLWAEFVIEANRPEQAKRIGLAQVSVTATAVPVRENPDDLGFEIIPASANV